MTSDRETALTFMEALWAADFETTDRLFSENARWFFQLGMPQAEDAREWPAREALRRIVDDLFGKFDPNGFNVTPTRIIGDNRDIAIEYEACGKTSFGADYQNYYVTVLTIEGGTVTEIRPYNDTAHMLQMLSP
jgi:ketosteroid isomerase-like protein